MTFRFPRQLSARSCKCESSTHPLGSKQVVVEGSEPLPGVVTAIRSAHEVFNDQSDVDEADAVVRRQVSLQNHTVLGGGGRRQAVNKGG